MRPDWDEYFLTMAILVESRGTCARRKVGCVLVDETHRILSTGYNGVPHGWKHCTEYPCLGAEEPSGSGLDKCEAVHAEQNALINCPDPRKIHTVYCTTSPCVSCTKLFLNTDAKRIVFIEEYPHNESRGLWERANREWTSIRLATVISDKLARLNRS